VHFILTGFWFLWLPFFISHQDHASKALGVLHLLPLRPLCGPPGTHLSGIPITQLALVLAQGFDLYVKRRANIDPQVRL
jgi:hypothetical protein